MARAATAGLELDELGDFLACEEDAIVLGGPGSGKTTAALVKANQEVGAAEWLPFERALFLSFARSTVARVAEAAEEIIDKQVRERVELTTYHAFAWRLIRSHGYLIQREPAIKLLPPHEAAVRLSNATRQVKGEEIARQKDIERRRLLTEEGLLDFDLFAVLAAEILERSECICRIASRRYPLIYLDEFQDTNSAEYRLIKCLIRESRIIALADPEQRIYEFRGADPKRIEEFSKEFSPATFDFAQRNHRSNGTDILDFANDLLNGSNSENDYNDVQIKVYPPRRGDEQHLWMKAAVLNAKNRLKDEMEIWSVGILVPTKRLMLAVSDFLLAEQEYNGRRFYSIKHEVGIDAEGPALAGVAIGRLMECSRETCDEAARIFLDDLCGHIVGRKGGRAASQQEAKLIDGLRNYLEKGRVQGSKRQRIVDDSMQIARQVATLEFTGDPYADWITVRDIIGNAESGEIRAIAWDARYLRFLRKGTQLRTNLARLWRSNGTYAGTVEAVKNAFIEEHFVSKSQEPRGVHVLTMHRSKGKEFDEVIIYEGNHADRIVRRPNDDSVVAQARLSLRVAVSRARKRVTILTPRQKRCELL